MTSEDCMKYINRARASIGEEIFARGLIDCQYVRAVKMTLSFCILVVVTLATYTQEVPDYRLLKTNLVNTKIKILFRNTTTIIFRIFYFLVSPCCQERFYFKRQTETPTRLLVLASSADTDQPAGCGLHCLTRQLSSFTDKYCL